MSRRLPIALLAVAILVAAAFAPGPLGFTADAAPAKAKRATTVKSSKSNTSDRARTTTVKSSKSNTSDRMGGGGGRSGVKLNPQPEPPSKFGIRY